MSSKISITILFAIVFSIVAVFAATQVLAQPPETWPENFVDHQNNQRTATFERRGNVVNAWRDSVAVPTGEFRRFNEFRFCEKDPAGDVSIDGEKYSCHELNSAKDKSLLMGNPSCPYFLKPPGIWINLCP